MKGNYDFYAEQEYSEDGILVSEVVLEKPKLNTTQNLHVLTVLNGGKGSGFFGHEGRLGQVGGSVREDTSNLPLARGANWNDLHDNDYRDILRRRAKKGERIEIVPNLEKLHQYAISKEHKTQASQKVFFGLSGKKFSDMRIGEEFSSLGARSTSYNLERASQYGKDGGVFELAIPTGVQAVEASVFGIDELVLLPGSSFRVVGEDNGVFQLEMTDDGSDWIKDLYEFQKELDSISGISKDINSHNIRIHTVLNRTQIALRLPTVLMNHYGPGPHKSGSRQDFEEE